MNSVTPIPRHKYQERRSPHTSQLQGRLLPPGHEERIQRMERNVEMGLQAISGEPIPGQLKLWNEGSPAALDAAGMDSL